MNEVLSKYIRAADLIAVFTKRLEDHTRFITKHGEDPEEITNWVWESHSS